MKKKIEELILKFLIWLLRWLITFNACYKINNLSWRVLKSCYNLTLGLEYAIKAYNNGEITKEEYDTYFDIYKNKL